MENFYVDFVTATMMNRFINLVVYGFKKILIFYKIRKLCIGIFAYRS